ncbi:MAG TPA: molybdopterin-dependent oxidoreductase, partial [bacterium]|nr:molybdopterin-dependent oxidoreductase [bacterium]
SRLNENKVKKPKAVPLGPTVMLDAERCILCSRCVRFTDEISKTSELGIVNRGDRGEITVFPGKELDNPYSGNVVDICPVGALTDRDFRFKIRVWYLKSGDSVCNGCSRGCNTQVQYNLDRPHHGKGERVMRIKPRFNEHINKWWICDEGRYGYKFHDHNRILNPLKRKEGHVEELSWHKILPEAAQCLASSKNKFGVILSPQLSNEELFLAERLFKNELKAENIFLVSPAGPGFQDDILIRADKNPNSKGAEIMGFSYDDKGMHRFLADCEEGLFKGVLVFGSDLLTRLKEKNILQAVKKLEWSIFIGSNHNLMSEYAAYVLPAATCIEKEGTFTNFEGRVQKFGKILEPLGEAQPEWRILATLARELGIHFHYDRAEEIFNDLALNTEFFGGLTYENLGFGGSDIRTMAAPTIPALEQDANIL